MLEAARQVEATKKVQDSLKPLRETIVKHSLARHKDRDVRLLVSICASEIFRVMAPEPPFEDKYIPVRDFFTEFFGSHLCFLIIAAD